MKKDRIAAILVALVALVAVTASATPIAIANPSFETCPSCSVSTNGFALLGTGNTDLTGWTVVSGDIEWSTPYTPTSGWNAGDLNHSLDLNGTTAGAIQQIGFSLTPGTYDMSFLMSGGPGGGERDVVLLVQVKSGVNIEQQQLFTYHVGASNTRENMLWEQKNWTFVLTGTADTLVIASQEFGSGGSGTGFGPALDMITLDLRDEGVPEPGTLSMFLGAGLLGVIAVVRRRNS